MAFRCISRKRGKTYHERVTNERLRNVDGELGESESVREVPRGNPACKRGNIYAPQQPARYENVNVYHQVLGNVLSVETKHGMKYGMHRDG